MNAFSALNIGVGGVLAQSGAISDISQNISNAQTVGYKEGLTTFSELVSDSSANNYSVNGNGAPDTGLSFSGVQGGTEQLVSVQGPISSTDSATDIAISGPGFFAVSPTAKATLSGLEFTRAGSFTANADGNYVNAAGQFLQAWALNPDGTLPADLAAASVTSSAGAAALVPVNIQKIIEVPVPTTTVSVQANLDASGPVFPGASDTAVMDKNNLTDYGISANAIIVPDPAPTGGPGGIDGIAQGDQFTISTGLNPTGTTYTYGGITFSRDITTGAADGASGAALQTPVTLAAGSGAAAAFTFNPVTPTSMTINLGTNTPASLGITQAGQVIKLSGTAAAGLNVNNITSLDGDYYITGMTSNPPGASNTITVTIPSTITPPSPLLLTGSTYTVGALSNSVTVSGITVPSGLAMGDTLTIAGAPSFAGLNGATDIDGNVTVTGVTGNSITFTIAGTSNGAGGSASGTGSTAFDNSGGLAAGTATVSSRLFSGNILDASNSTGLLISTPSDFTTAALSFTINTPTLGTSTFTYTPVSPNAALGQFDSLTTLAAAVNHVSGLTARIVNNQLYIASTNGNDAITFANGSATGSNSSPPLAGIDWIGELGLTNVAQAAAGVNRFSTLQGLANQVNNSSGLAATVNNPLSAASVKINVSDPLDTISFADASTNSGSLLGELGLAPSLSGSAFAAQTAGPFGPAYIPTNPAANMASGAVPADFTIPVTVVDSLGNNHTIDAMFLKTGTNSWAVEINAQPATDVTAANGQLATGTVTFNGDGTMASISPSLTQIAIPWTAAGAAASTIAFNWGTAGAIGIGLTNGLSQFAGANTITSIQQNGIQANTSTTTSISSSGVISVTYANGGTRALYQIPLAEFVDPDQLQAESGNLYTATQDAGALTFLTSGPNSGVSLYSNALEDSNVDLANQLTNLIIAQNAYQANTKLISTSDSMLQTLNQMDQSITV